MLSAPPVVQQVHRWKAPTGGAVNVLCPPLRARKESYASTHTHTHTHTHTQWEPPKQKHKKSSWSKLLRSCRAARDVFRSVKVGCNATQCWCGEVQTHSLLPAPDQNSSWRSPRLHFYQSSAHAHTHTHTPTPTPTHAQTHACTQTLRTAIQEQSKEKRLEKLLRNCRAVLDVFRSGKESTTQVQMFF